MDKEFDDQDLDEVEEEEEEDMPLKKREPCEAAQKAAETIEEVTASVTSMSIRLSMKEKYRSWSMDFTFPFMMKTFVHNAHESATIDVILPTVHEDFVHPRIVEGGTQLSVTIAVPEFFPEEERVMVSAENEDLNTNQASSHQKLCRRYESSSMMSMKSLVSPS